LHAVYASYGVREEDAGAVVAYLMAIGAVGTIVWLAMIRALRRRQRWARLVAKGAPLGPSAWPSPT
jgi:hypothetical protein